MILINSEIDGLVRHALTTAAGYLVGAGIMPIESVEGIVTGLVGLAAVIWSIAKNNAQKPVAKKPVATP